MARHLSAYSMSSDPKSAPAGKLSAQEKTPDGSSAFREPRSSQAPSRVGRVQLSVHVEMPVRKELRTLAAKQDVTLQHLLCRAVNDLLEKHGIARMADEEMLPRGGAAHKR
jgi:hypothetical protein